MVHLTKQGQVQWGGVPRTNVLVKRVYLYFLFGACN